MTTKENSESSDPELRTPFSLPSGDHACIPSLDVPYSLGVMEGTYSPSQLPASSIKYHHSYFTPAEVEIMSEKQRGKMTVTQEDKIRQNACGFIDAIGSRIGL